MQDKQRNHHDSSTNFLADKWSSIKYSLRLHIRNLRKQKGIPKTESHHSSMIYKQQMSLCSRFLVEESYKPLRVFGIVVQGAFQKHFSLENASK
jgi:hypothetical protein